MRYSLIIMGAALCALLTGCGKPTPSSADIQSAVQRYMLGPDSKIIDANHIWLDKSQTYRQSITAEKIACTSGKDAPGAVCDFNVATCYAHKGETCEAKSHAVSARFVKDKTGWTYMPTDPAQALARPVDILNVIMMQGVLGDGGAADLVPACELDRNVECN